MFLALRIDRPELCHKLFNVKCISGGRNNAQKENSRKRLPFEHRQNQLSCLQCLYILNSVIANQQLAWHLIRQTNSYCSNCQFEDTYSLYRNLT